MIPPNGGGPTIHRHYICNARDSWLSVPQLLAVWRAVILVIDIFLVGSISDLTCTSINLVVKCSNVTARSIVVEV